MTDSPPPAEPQTVPDFSGCRILVAGDVMLDRYWRGSTGRVSPEAPVPVVRFQALEERPGGAANVAANLALLGVRTSLIGVTGEDAEGDILAGLTAARGIAFERVTTPEIPTTTKQRVISRNQQLMRLDTEGLVPPAVAFALVRSFEALVAEADLVVLSDYAKGALATVERLIEAARRRGVPVLVDPKGADFERYRRATALTPNLAEFEAVVGPVHADAALASAARRLLQSLQLEFMLVTRSERGMSLIASAGRARHLPTNAREVFDVTGASDTVIATLAAALGAGVDPLRAAQLANAAAGVVVRRLGAAGVTPPELRRAAAEAGLFDAARAPDGRLGRVLSASRAVDEVAAARARGERVVMTNGCFDVLHAGHVSHLQAARGLGARLLVAVNDDGSVRSLKGPQRPVNPLEDRLAVLLGLDCVDWVVPFGADSPRELICRVRPDVLVKGGDYTAEQVDGADCVRRAGGEVRILPLLDGRSTSAIVERLGKRLRADPPG